jgi:hypothetical protein
MTINLGSGVSRNVDTTNKSYSQVIWREGKPPLDSELNLVGQIASDTTLATTALQSGVLIDPTKAELDFSFDHLYSNQFGIKPFKAVVNGWILDVAGVNADTVDTNLVALDAPPSSEGRTDLVFLEVWQVVIPAGLSDYKPATDKVWLYGNTQYLGTDNPNDEILDAELGFETTRRVQTQYRLRVVNSASDVNLFEFPEGLGSSVVLAQGANTSTINVTFQHHPTDAGLWYAEDPDLNTVDGKSYAIPLCAVFRRNSAPFTAVVTGGVPNQNGAAYRTPGLTNATLTQVTLAQDISQTTTGVVDVDATGLSSSAFQNLIDDASPQYMLIGNEVITISAVDYVGATITIASRGVAGSSASYHASGSIVSLYNTRPDGLYADEVDANDIIDLRHAVNFGDWDFTRLLKSSVGDLLYGRLHTTFKQASAGSASKGTRVQEVTIMNANRTHAIRVDGCDGHRTIWSDAAVTQSDLTVLLDSETTEVDAVTGFTTQVLNVNTADYWTFGADYQPKGFFGGLASTERWQANSMVFLHLGGLDGQQGLRGGFINTPRPDAVRFIAPNEYQGKVIGKKAPITLKFISEENQRPNADAETAYSLELAPLESENYERPFICLGGLLDSSLKFTGILADLVEDSGALTTAVLTNHPDISGVFLMNIGTTISETLSVGHGSTTIADLLTANGTDLTGSSSSLYAIVYGDTAQHMNNGAFRVVGLPLDDEALSGLPDGIPGAREWVSLVPLNPDFGANWVQSDAGMSLTIEFRTQKMDSRDGMTGYTGNDDDMCIVLTDLSSLNVGKKTNSQVVVNTTVLWHSGHSALAHLPVEIHGVSIRNNETGYLRNNKLTLDGTASSIIPDEIIYPASTSTQLWNRLSSLGYNTNDTSLPSAVSFGGNIIGGADIDRECEVFSDLGSKTLLIRPFKSKFITMQGWDLDGTNVFGLLNWDGGAMSGNTVNPADLFASPFGLTFALPAEVMPRFGRQDIPFHKNTSTVSDLILTGLNHLFLDSLDETDPVFNIIGGDDNQTSGNQVYGMMLSTNVSYGNYNSVGNVQGGMALGVRKQEYTDVPTSDFGSILRGLELPPFYGLVRVYGVFELNDFIAKTDVALTKGAFNSDRLTLIGNPPTNLLRTDADKYTMYIRQGGGSDITGGDVDAHTYMLTEHALDIGRIPTYADGDTFADFDYVVECSVFGFGTGFINKNSLVVARTHNGEGTLIDSTFITTPATGLLKGVGVVVPSALSNGDEVYIHYSRDVYQGDPYHTRSSTLNTYEPGDAPYRYGSLTPEKFTSTTRGQVDGSGNPAYDLANIRPLNILASMDFYLTLGTGCIGGDMFESTFTDVGRLVGDSEVSSQTDEKRHGLGVFTDAPEGVEACATLIFSPQALLQYASSEDLFTDAVTGFKLTFTLDGVDYTFTNAVIVGTSFSDWLFGLVEAVNASTSSTSPFKATTNGSNTLYLYSSIKGAFGNQVKLSYTLLDTIQVFEYPAYVYLASGVVLASPSFPTITGFLSYKNAKTSVLLTGGVDEPVNAGNGSTPNALMGMTTRLPLGLYVSDWDFLGEDILNDESSYLQGFDGSLRTSKIDLPLSDLGVPYTLNNGLPGEILLMCDGAEGAFEPYNAITAPGGTQRYRIARGGGVVYNGQAGANDLGGAPISWLTTAYPSQFKPVLKGGALACKALLVQNFYEEAFTTPNTIVRSYGDEIQLVVITNMVTKNGENLIINGLISPSGYGEGYAAADRYRIKGRPLLQSRVPVPSTDIVPTPLFS